MKLPAVAIVAAFAGGVLLRLAPLRAFHAAHFSLPVYVWVAGIFLLILGFAQAWRGITRASAATSLAAWVGLAFFFGRPAELPFPAEPILSRSAAGQVPLTTSLRWRGVLLSAPPQLP